MPTTQHGPHPLIPPLRDAVVVIIVHVLRTETALELFSGRNRLCLSSNQSKDQK